MTEFSQDVKIEWFERTSQYEAFSLYYKLVPPRIRPRLVEIMSHIGKDFNHRLSDLTDIFKKYQHNITSDWEFYTELAVLQDYAEPIGEEEILEKVKYWVQGDRDHEFADGGFCDLLALGCDEFLSKSQPFQKEPLTVEEYLSDPMYWATSGASYEKRLETIHEGRTYKALKSKWATALASSVDEMLQIFYRDMPQENRAVVKRELKKSRMIIVGDMANYLRMSYISYWLEDILRQHPNTTLFYSSSQMFILWLMMLRDTSIPTSIEQNFPLDESEYDHEVVKKMIAIALNAVRKLITQIAPERMKGGLLKALDLTTKSILSPLGTVQVGKMARVLISKGLLSGWRWTAFLNTILNYGKVTAFRMKLVQRLGLPEAIADPVITSVHQGDDLRARTRSPVHTQLLMDLYTETGFKVNPSKVFMSNVSDEYLRQLAKDGLYIGGYPARGVISLLYRNPVSREFRVGEDRIFELASNWLLVGRRCSTPPAVLESMMIKDISRANLIPKQQVKDILHASAGSGGLGLEPINYKRITLHKSKPSTSVIFKDGGIASKYKYPEVVKSIWAKGVSLHKKIKVEYTPFSVEVTEQVLTPLATRYMDTGDPGPIEPTVRVDVSPSTIAMYQEIIPKQRVKEIEEDLPDWLSRESIAEYYRLKNRASLRVIKDWLTGKLPFRAPNSHKQGMMVIAPIFKRQSRLAWHNIRNANNISMKLVERAALTAEQHTQTYLARLRVRMVG